ncbi:MAG: putative hydroxymethylpyrimidine transport system substrate-binding protein [Thermoleophilaceae bacterium]|nr:putative hydroxymethylpyrimidine transport system substrate-binding protein [Thermoleophilaceae bacterium]
MRRPTLLIAACLATALVAAGCGERKETIGPGGTQKLEVMLDWIPNPDHAGIYTAQGRHLFRDVGLNVKIDRPPDPSSPIKQVAARRVDLAISYEPEVLRARDQGLDVVAVAAVVPRPLTSVLSLPPNTVDNPSELAGKRIGTAGIDYQDAFIDAIAKRGGVDPASIKHVNVGFDLNKQLLTKKVDATLGGFVNVEQVDLALQGKKPAGFTVDKAGIPPYDELVLVTSGKTLIEKKDAIRSFIGALARGTRIAERNPAAAAAYLTSANKDLPPKLQLAGTKATPFGQPPGRPFGYQDPTAWGRFAAFMKNAGILKREPDTGKALTNELLPGQGLGG